MTGASALFVLSGYVINVVLGRSLGPVDYGLFGVVIGLMTLINSLQSAAIPQAVAKLTAEGTASESDLLFTGGLLQAGAGIALGVALFVIAEPLAGVFDDERLTALFRITALAFPAYALFTLFLGFNGGRGRYMRQALMLAVYSVAKALLVLVLGILLAVPGAILGYVVAPLVAIAAAGVWSLRRMRLVPMRPILSYSVPLLLLALLSVGHLNLDLFFVKSLLEDPASAGYYTAAQSIARVPYFLTTGFAIILLPAVARSAAGDPRNAAPLVRQAVRVGLLVIAPVAALLIGAANDLIALLYSDTYEPATQVLMVLSPAMGALAMAAMLASLLAGVGHARYAVYAAGAGVATSGIHCLLLIGPLGMSGAAIAALMGASVALVAALLAAVRVFSFDVPWASIARAGAASVVVGIAALFINGPVQAVIAVPLLSAVYAVLLVAIRELRSEDWQRIRGASLAAASIKAGD